MALTTDELQSIVTQVLSALRTNSNTIGQLPPVISLGAEDSFEIDGGKRVTYETLYALINYINDERHKNLSSELGNLKRDHSADVGTIRDRIAAVIRVLEEHGSSISENKSAIDNIGDYIIPEEIAPKIDYNRVLIDRLNDSVGARTRTVTDDAGTATVPGIAPLDESGRVPGRFLPSYVDDAMDFDGMALNVAAFAGERYEGNLRDAFHRVLYLPGPNRFILEVTPSSSTGKPQAPEYYPKWELGEEHALCMGRESEEGYFPLKGKTYYCPATNKAYRWTGSSLVPTGSDLDLGEEAGTAFAGDRGRALELEKADRTELSPVMVRDAEEDAEMPEPDFPELMLRKNEQALTAEERRQVMVNLGRPDTAVFYDMWDSACVMQGQLFTDGSCAVPVIGEADRNKGTCTISDTELDYSDAVRVFLCRKMLMGTNLQEAYSASNVGVQKAFFPIVSSGATSTYGMYSGQSKVRVVQLGQYNGRLSSSNAGYMFYGCTSLEEIRGRLELLTNDTSRTFTGCTSLREVRLRIGSQCSGVSLSDCPHLSPESIQWLIDDRLGSHDATITLHATAFARLTEEILAAAEAKFLTITTP